MPLNSTSVSGPSPMQWMERTGRTPWLGYVEPFQIAPHVWYAGGNDWVACYLIETTEGCILIDTALHESVYLLLENLRRMGHVPSDIKKILLSHAHIDHIGGAKALKELTGAEVWLGHRDVEEYLHKRPELASLDPTYTCCLFDPDKEYDYSTPITLGNISIQPIATPGHTPGCTSFTFRTTDEATGKTYTVAMHGGIGLNTLSKQWFLENDQPESLMDEYIAQLRECDKMQIDITIPSHTNQVGILSLVNQNDRSDYTPFIDPEIWHLLMNERLERALKLQEENAHYQG